MTRSMRLRLFAFGLLGVVAIAVTAVRYAHLPEQAGVGRYHVTMLLPDGAGLYPRANVTYRGTTIGTVTVPNTGGAQTYQDVSTTFTGATTDSEPLYFVATTGGANVNWIEFAGRGITDNQPPAVAIRCLHTARPRPVP